MIYKYEISLQYASMPHYVKQQPLCCFTKTYQQARLAQRHSLDSPANKRLPHLAGRPIVRTLNSPHTGAACASTHSAQPPHQVSMPKHALQAATCSPAQLLEHRAVLHMGSVQPWPARSTHELPPLEWLRSALQRPGTTVHRMRLTKTLLQRAACAWAQRCAAGLKDTALCGAARKTTS